MDKESQLYDAFVNALINKVGAEQADVSILKLAKEFINERSLGANPKTHQPTKDLQKAVLPFEDSDEDNVTPMRASKKAK